MKLEEIFEKEQKKQLIKPNSFDKKGKPMKYPNVYTNKGAGGNIKVSPQTVVFKDSNTGKIYGRRTIYQTEV